MVNLLILDAKIQNFNLFNQIQSFTPKMFQKTNPKIDNNHILNKHLQETLQDDQHHARWFL